MAFDFTSLNWLAVLASVIAGQMVSTIWFVALFGEPWAQEYGASSRQQHAKELPGYTYGIGLLCTITLVLSIATLQQALAIETATGALGLGLFVALGFCVASGLPGQAFLKRWRAFFIAYGSQIVMILVISLILAIWK